MLPFLFKKKQANTFDHLKTKWEGRYKNLQEELWAKHGEAFHNFLTVSRQWSIGAVAGIVMLASSGAQTAAADSPIAVIKPLKQLNNQSQLILDLIHFLPQGTVAPLTQDQQSQITSILSDFTGFKVTSQLQGINLNTNYGYIGEEQHLERYPGDTMESQLTTGEDKKLYYSSGMAPGLGAWRYFAPSKEQMTQEDNLREKYYVAVQTFLTPGYNENVKEYSEFFKYRKVLVVNPQNGRVIVCDIGDAGPSPTTGKQFGGSPEVMHFLERVDGAQKGTVLLFFIDDPEDSVPLGPVTL